MKATKWIAEQRKLHRAKASLFPAGIRTVMKPFFGEEILDSVRVRIMLSIGNPEFFPEFEAKYQVALPDFSGMHGLTLDDTVLLCQGVDDVALVFHELVHVTQYRLLGISEFARRYVAVCNENGLDYGSIPLEIDAFGLEGRYRAEPSRPFSVLEEVKRQLN